MVVCVTLGYGYAEAGVDRATVFRCISVLAIRAWTELWLESTFSSDFSEDYMPFYFLSIVIVGFTTDALYH